MSGGCGLCFRVIPGFVASVGPPEGSEPRRPALQVLRTPTVTESTPANFAGHRWAEIGG